MQINTREAEVAEVPTEKTRYTESELNEFEVIILKKITEAKEEAEFLLSSLTNPNRETTNGNVGEGDSALNTGAKEEINVLAGRQLKLVDDLERALIRIKNKTYGICKDTGKLIPQERLRAVPHTTLSMEAKLKQN